MWSAPLQAFSLGAIVVATAMGQAPHGGVTNLDGEPVDVLRGAAGVRATALVFLRSDCPLANQAAPEIERVREQFDGRGARLWLVYLDRAQSGDEIRRHKREYRLRAPAVRDADHHLVRLAQAQVTPSAAVFVHQNGARHLVYRGRLDDRAVALGRTKTRATRFDLRDALEAALADRAAALVSTPAIGCEIADLR
jgi:hypothetical protein